MIMAYVCRHVVFYFRDSIRLSDTMEDGLSALVMTAPGLLPIARLESSVLLIIFVGVVMASFQYYLGLLGLYATLASCWHVHPPGPPPPPAAPAAALNYKTLMKKIGTGVLMLGKGVWHRLSQRGRATILTVVSLLLAGQLFPGFKFFVKVLLSIAYWKIRLAKLKWHGLQPLHSRSLWMIVPIAVCFAKYRLCPFKFQEEIFKMYDYEIGLALGGGPAFLVFMGTLYDVRRAYQRIAEKA